GEIHRDGIRPPHPQPPLKLTHLDNGPLHTGLLSHNSSSTPMTRHHHHATPRAPQRSNRLHTLGTQARASECPPRSSTRPQPPTPARAPPRHQSPPQSPPDGYRSAFQSCPRPPSPPDPKPPTPPAPDHNAVPGSPPTATTGTENPNAHGGAATNTTKARS